MLNFFRAQFLLVFFAVVSLSQEQAGNRPPASVCNPNPCLYGGMCEMITGNDYQCTGCHQLTSGKNCEKLNCGYTNCFAWNGTLYMALESEAGWEEANRKCINNGMRLAMPKSQEAHEFLSGQVSLVYGGASEEAGGGGGWWMGLRRDAGGWRWLDGSRLGPYIGGNDNFTAVSSDLYVVLSPLGPNGGLLQWSSVQGGAYFPLCEKRSVRSFAFSS